MRFLFAESVTGNIERLQISSRDSFLLSFLYDFVKNIQLRAYRIPIPLFDTLGLDVGSIVIQKCFIEIWEMIAGKAAAIFVLGKLVEVFQYILVRTGIRITRKDMAVFNLGLRPQFLNPDMK